MEPVYHCPCGKRIVGQFEWEEHKKRCDALPLALSAAETLGKFVKNYKPSGVIKIGNK